MSWSISFGDLLDQVSTNDGLDVRADAARERVDTVAGGRVANQGRGGVVVG